LTVTAIHTADFHLDRNFGFPWIDRVERRRKDLYDNFQRIVDFAIAEKPDFFLICGDVFDRVKPSNEAKIFLVRKARELYDARIQLVVIGGNHDIPKFDSGPMAIELLNSAGLATVFARSDAFESRKFHVGTEEVIVAGKSYFAAKESYNPLSESLPLQKDTDYLVLMIHGSLNGMGVLPSIPGMASQNPFTANDVPKIADYLALGHFHNTFERQIPDGPLIGNPGSIERLTKAEASEEKGFYWLELTDSAQVSFEKLPSRSMEERTIDVSSDMSNLREKIVKEIENWTDPEKILDVRLVGQTTADEFLKLRPNEIYEQFHDFYFSLYVDRSQLQVENVGPLITEEIGTPIETYRKRLDLQIETATDEQTKQFLKLIKDEGCKYLGEVE
jgi:DNA repair exonuclease SbcCD nuclease subunit